jgi:hypothetical protein
MRDSPVAILATVVCLQNLAKDENAGIQVKYIYGQHCIVQNHCGV